MAELLYWEAVRLIEGNKGTLPIVERIRKVFTVEITSRFSESTIWARGFTTVCTSCKVTFSIRPWWCIERSLIRVSTENNTITALKISCKSQVL